MLAAIAIGETTSPTSSVRECLHECNCPILRSGLSITEAVLWIWLSSTVGNWSDDPALMLRRKSNISCSRLDSDVKDEPLKIAQGLICVTGFRSGALRWEFFFDVPQALTMWHDMSIALRVFSLGSVRNQQAWSVHARR